MGIVKVNKNVSANTWWWSCSMPLCGQEGWDMGHPRTVNAAIAHLDKHRNVGFSRKDA